MINKPINPSPHNCSVDVTKDWNIEYEIPNNEKIDGRYISVDDLETGENIISDYQELSESTGKIVFDIPSMDAEYSNREYSWSSFYWQTPTKDPASSHVICGYGDSNNEIFIKPDGNSIKYLKPTYNGTYTPSPQYIISRYGNGNCIYSKDIWEENHTSDDDTSAFCCKGQLEDYFGFPYFITRKVFLDEILSVGLGRCVIGVYADDYGLVSWSRVLAYDNAGESSTGSAEFCIIVDNRSFWDEIETLTELKNYNDNSLLFYKFYYIRIYDTDNLNKQQDIGGMLKHNDKYYLIKNCGFKDHYYTATLIGDIPETSEDESSTAERIFKTGDTVNVWSRNDANFNTTPSYYFRTKEPPVISVDHCGNLQGEKENTLKDVKSEFGVNYTTSSTCGLNYFYICILTYSYAYRKWMVKERSPMLYNANDTYEFTGFMDGQNYKVLCVCVDKDGDEWTTDEVWFTVSNPATKDDAIFAKFNSTETTIDIEFTSILSKYNKASVEFYKAIKSDSGEYIELEYAGGGVAKRTRDGAIFFDRFRDYNIKNDSYYNYYMRVEYTGKESDVDEGIDMYFVADNVHTEFEGTSILGLRKISDTTASIIRSFNLRLRMNNDTTELSNEMSREYINSFGRYPKELKGHQNYISGSCSGLLGSERNGVYEEPKGIRDIWNDFVGDDSVKLYRGIDGETMVISIDTSRVKPFYSPNSGLVNEVYFTFKEIASANQYVIFTTEKTGG